MIEWVHTECVGLDNLFVDSLDHIYDKMPYLNSVSDITKKYKISVHTLNNSFL